MTSFIMHGYGWRMLRLHTHTHEHARTFLNKAGSNLHHVFKDVETMKSVSTGVDSQISS